MTAKVMFSGGSRAWANNLNDLRERWNIRREEPVKFAVPVELFKQDVLKLSRDELLNLKNELIVLLDKGKKELYRHQNIYRTEGVSLDREIYMDLFNTIKAINYHVQEVNHALAQEKRQRSAERSATLDSLIIKTTRKKVSDALWKEILDEANEIYKGKSDDE